MNDKERRDHELEFVRAAYESTEAWCTQEGGRDTVYRLLKVGPLAWLLRITMPENYPSGGDILILQLTVDEERTTNRKQAFQQQPTLLHECQQVAESMTGEEALYAVLNAAEQWIQNNENINSKDDASKKNDGERNVATLACTGSHMVLGRRLIYSHHIISKRKRADILELASHLNLTGFMKIGWPGMIIIEGSEEDCQSFYDGIKGWSWKYLVVRGEMQENCSQIENNRRFPVFSEVEDMSVVASHCREVGLEALFRTSMKVYCSDHKRDETDKSLSAQPSNRPYGALVLVDHMNDGHSYRKWLRKVCYENGVLLLLQLCYQNDDYLKRPKIIVGLVGGDVRSVLKQWRTSKVDVDSKGKPCLERMMTILAEGDLKSVPHDEIKWEQVGLDERYLNTTTDKVTELAHLIGGIEWRNALEQLWVL